MYWRIHCRHFYSECFLFVMLTVALYSFGKSNAFGVTNKCTLIAKSWQDHINKKNNFVAQHRSQSMMDASGVGGSRPGIACPVIKSTPIRLCGVMAPGLLAFTAPICLNQRSLWWLTPANRTGKDLLPETRLSRYIIL